MKSFQTVILILGTLTLIVMPLVGQQIELDSVLGSGRDAIRIAHADGDGVQITSARRFGVYVFDAGDNGVHVDRTEGDGIHVGYAGDDGVYVSSALDNGVHVNQAGGHSMNIQGDKSASTLDGHIGLIKNRSSASSPDVLALQVGSTNPGAGSNFLTFYNGNDVILGEVQGNSSGGVSYVSSGSDYAEYLPALDQTETFNPGDVVGVYRGHISKQTANADRVMVITDQAAVLGNLPMSGGDDVAEIPGYETVSFIGQVRTRVRDTVHSGDWIVASGKGDGTAIAVASEEIELHHQIVGRAWESSSEPGIKRVNTAVGLDHTEAYREIITTLKQENLEQQAQITLLYQLIMEIRGIGNNAGSEVELNNAGPSNP